MQGGATRRLSLALKMPNTGNTPKSGRIPKRNDDRIILHFDYDCFYASVFENENPSLKSLPVGIKQKSILATCNYVARGRGVRKLMLASDAVRVCPDLVLLNGEDLTRFRAASKRLWSLLRAHSWNGRVERLGLDEVFLDVTDIVEYNRELLNPHALTDSFFQLDRADPVKGFAFDGSRFCGCVEPSSTLGRQAGMDLEEPHSVALMLASHLAGYLRRKLDEDLGYTSSSGISTSKLLAKLAASVHKPNNQTTLLTTVEGAVQTFMDAHTLRQVPGIGMRTGQAIEEHILSHTTREGTLTVGQVLRHPGMSPDFLDRILDRPGAEHGSGEKVWNLLHGVDPSEVKEASDVPTQISVEDTYMSRPLQTPADVTRELRALASSLIKRLRVDLTDDVGSTGRWLAYPKTLRLSTRTKPKTSISNGESSASSFNRSSRSAPLPSFIFHNNNNTSSNDEEQQQRLAERLVNESLLPLFRRLHPSPRPMKNLNLNIALLNICVTNMVVVAVDAVADDKAKRRGNGNGNRARDISSMFKTQENKLREWTVYDTTPTPFPIPTPTPAQALPPQFEFISSNKQTHQEEEVVVAMVDIQEQEKEGGEGGKEEEEEEPGSHRCSICNHAIPTFALAAHERFHDMGE
ncbi:hypothetical protein F5Y17DRAFT_449922 [Xylariaceae sp. FL0594]|nr:hypothetical protein F5Y17DRAFT_449922 [Xylariaceae sp. FL0594]